MSRSGDAEDRETAVRMGGSPRMLNIFWKSKYQDVLMGWVWEGKGKEISMIPEFLI